MLCQSCGKNEAVFHYKSSVNGNVTEQHLCRDCAAALGAEGIGAAQQDFFGSMLTDIFGIAKPGYGVKQGGAVCPQCGSTARDIARRGKIGCAKCWEVFSDMLLPHVRRIHGNVRHAGRIPGSAAAGLRAKHELEELKAQLKTAVEAQEYEQAAVLRDRIKALEEGENNA